jgi:serine/threonine protein kinase
MRLIEGTTLAKRLVQGRINPRDGAELLAQVADAVQAAHARGVLHRDLKPSNILIDAAGRPHVSDFGLAKRLADDASVTHTGAILGTPCYMSPEQAAGSRGDVGPASDVWSLGAILYQCVTGRPPFQASSPVDVLLMVLEQDPVPPRMLDPKIDRDLEMIVLKCLQKPPDLRYSSAAALADEPATDLTLRDPAETDKWVAALGGVSLLPGHVRVPRDKAPESRTLGPLTEWPGFAEGAWWVQDAAAVLPARLFGDVQGARVLDLCAAPGGKTMQLAAAGADVLAVDQSSKRLRRATCRASWRSSRRPISRPTASACCPRRCR